MPLPDSLQEQADEAVALGFEGVVVYFDQGPSGSQQIASGWHNRDTQEPARTDALFKIASISKLYDAAAVAKLVAEGKLSLDKTVADYFPHLKDRIEYADQITLRMLVQHRSGIPNYTDTPEFWSAPVQSFEESLALILDQPANFAPDTDYEYCNTNYLLINRIMDNALGYPNFQYIQKEILQPLNLHNTYGSLADYLELDSSQTGANLDRVMSGYHVDYPYDLKEDDLGMLATAEDVGVFVRALNDGSVFTAREKEIYASLYEYKHGGWVPGYQSFVEYYEDIDAVLVTFYSTTDKDLLYWNLSEILNSRMVGVVSGE
ncbi:MAG: serine hydrolase domain-containing protein [Schleiferiaceae bacterium]